MSGEGLGLDELRSALVDARAKNPIFPSKEERTAMLKCMLEIAGCDSALELVSAVQEEIETENTYHLVEYGTDVKFKPIMTLVNIHKARNDGPEMEKQINRLKRNIINFDKKTKFGASVPILDEHREVLLLEYKAQVCIAYLSESMTDPQGYELGDFPEKVQRLFPNPRDFENVGDAVDDSAGAKLLEMELKSELEEIENLVRKGKWKRLSFKLDVMKARYDKMLETLRLLVSHLQYTNLGGPTYLDTLRRPQVSQAHPARTPNKAPGTPDSRRGSSTPARSKRTPEQQSLAQEFKKQFKLSDQARGEIKKKIIDSAKKSTLREASEKLHANSADPLFEAGFAPRSISSGKKRKQPSNDSDTDDSSFPSVNENVVSPSKKGRKKQIKWTPSTSRKLIEAVIEKGGTGHWSKIKADDTEGVFDKWDGVGLKDRWRIMKNNNPVLGKVAALNGQVPENLKL